MGKFKQDEEDGMISRICNGNTQLDVLLDLERPFFNKNKPFLP